MMKLSNTEKTFFGPQCCKYARAHAQYGKCLLGHNIEVSGKDEENGDNDEYIMARADTEQEKRVPKKRKMMVSSKTMLKIYRTIKSVVSMMKNKEENVKDNNEDKGKHRH